jgi:hypothetical protein
MSRVSGFYTYLIAALLAILMIALPASAYNVAMYGSNSGFNPLLHNNSVIVVESIPGSAGSDLDSNIDQFTQPSVDVIILAGDDTFTPSTAAKIDSAVAGGKILVVTYPCNRLFDASLPATNGGTTPAGQSLEITDPATKISMEIFAGLPGPFLLTQNPPDKEQAVSRKGAVPVLNYDTGLPALLYGKYGKGTVIEWTTTPVPAYMTEAEADTILDRLITRLLPISASTTTFPATTISVNTTPISQETTTTVTINPTGSGTPQVTTGGLTVYSSPAGASILIDGIYYGTTPANLTSIQQGNHIIRMVLSGYWDYEGTIYVIPGQISSSFGTLPPLSQYSSQPTPAPTAMVPIIIPVVTAAPTQSGGLLDNSNVLVAIIGVFTALIAAGVSVFTHVFKAKKE